MATRPNDYINRAQLGISVAQNWQQNYAAYNVNFTNKAAFLALAQSFYNKSNQNANQDALKKDNTENLKSISNEIIKSSARLKEYIRDAYSTNTDAMYAAYGFEKIGNGYTLPRDNDRLMQRLTMLLAKIQEAGNPIASRNQGLAYWQDLIARHVTEWTTSKNMKGQKATLSQECKELHKEVGNILSKIYRQIALDYPRDQVASVRRSFGFLNETYK
jgi:dTDP-4-amino-4,6-dideoxygalactose transaminase